MTRSPANVQEGLFEALLRLSSSPDLSEDEVRRIQQFAMRLIAEFSVLKAEEPAKSDEVGARY
jgi:hypothetical protein